MDIKCIAPLNILRSVYPEIPIGYKPCKRENIKLIIKGNIIWKGKTR